MRLCIDCRFSHNSTNRKPGHTNLVCFRKREPIISPVDGTNIQVAARSCLSERLSNRECGGVGRFFEEKGK